MEEASKLLTEYFTERTWIAILLAGLAIVVLAYFWLAVRAVSASKWWRIGYLPPFAFLYVLSFSRRVVAPLVLLLMGLVVAASPFVITRHLQPLLPRHAWEKNVDGELHVTLTGLSQFNYASLKTRKEISLLQMANADVTDQALEFLRDHPLLYELDVNGSQVTDVGLVTLKSLPKLKTLRLAKTKVTDDGFLQNLAGSDLLMEFDARETEIKSATLRKWKNAKEGRSYLK
jgi:hypothetical protein